MRKLYDLTLVVVFLAMVGVFIPTTSQRSALWTTTDNLKAADIIPYEQAYQRAKALSKVMHAQPINGKAYYEAIKEHRTLLAFKEKGDEFENEPWKRRRVPLEIILNSQFHQFTQWVDGMRNYPDQWTVARDLMDKDVEFQRAVDFQRYSRRYHWQAIGEYLQFKFLCMILLSVLFYLTLLVRRSGEINPALELANPMFWLAVLSGPFGLLFYSAEAREQTRRAVKWVSYATAACLSGFAAAPAQAQTVKPESGKKSPSATLTVDFKNSSMVGDSPDNQATRTSLYGVRFLAEQITVTTPSKDGWYNEAGVGVFLKKTPKTWLMAVGLVSHNNVGRRSFVTGLQFLKFGKRYTIAVPAIRYEQALDGTGTKAFAFVTNPVFRLGASGMGNRIGVAPEINLKKTLGKPLAWTMGAAIRVFPGKARKNSVELGMFRNQLGQWNLRSRFTVNFAF